MQLDPRSKGQPRSTTVIVIRPLLTFLALISFGIVGCKSTQSAQNAPLGASKNADKPAVMNGCRPAAGSEELRTTDSNGDGLPEICKYYKSLPDPKRPGQTHIALMQQHLDVNWDGKIDIKRTFSVEGTTTREEWDADYDGNIDEVRLFEDGLISRSDQDLDNDGHVEVIRYYQQGKLERKESDTNQDGKTDRWEYFNGQTVERIGIDENYDGTIDRWKKFSSETDSP